MDSQSNLNNQNNQNVQGYQNPYADPSSAPLRQPDMPAEENPYYIDPASVPSAVTVKKSKKKIWIPIVSVLLVACAAAAVVFFVILKNKPSAKEAVTKALMSPFSSDQPSLESRYLGLPALKEKIQSSPYQADIEIHIPELSGSSLPEQLSMLDNASFSMSSARDLNAKRCAGTFSVDVDNFPLELLYYFYDDKMAVSIPDMLDGYLEMSAANFGRDFNNSALSEMLGQKLDESLSFRIFDQAGSGSSQSTGTMDALLDKLEYKESSKKATITIGGKKQSCKCYKATLPAETIQDLFSSYAGILAATGSSYVSPDALQQYLPTEDIEFYVYTTKDGKLARIEFDQSFDAAGLSLDLNGTIDFTGKNAPADEISGSVSATLKGIPVVIQISSSKNENSTSYKRNTTVSLSAAGLPVGNLKAVSEFDTTTGKKHSEINVSAMAQTLISYEMNLLYKDVVAGERFSLEIQNISLDAMGMITAEINGSCSAAPYSDSIETPSGQKYDLFSMTTDELQQLLLTAVMDKLGSWY